jgi:multiple antibiotic resistance protein
MIVTMASSLNLADTVVTFLAFVGPQKTLLGFAQLARTLNARALRAVALATTVAAICVGAACALTAPWVADFFHISTPALELAAGLVFFVYAMGLVFGLHIDPAEPRHVPERDGGEHGEADPDPLHPFTSGFRAMLLPFVVSPLAVAAALQMSMAASDWGDRWIVVAALAVVAVIDGVSAVAFAPLLGRAHEAILEMLSRLLGILLAAVGVQLFLLGLSDLGVHLPH